VESDLTALLLTLCPRVSPDVAPTSTARPYVTYQAIGGATQRFVDGAAPTLRNTRVQINVWSSTRLEASQLIRQIEDALCAATAFTARPESEPVSSVDEDLGLRGAMQDFSIWAAR
jgi:hypothetical protein